MTAEPTYEALSARAAGSNVDPRTLLATDYLNHLNEPVMLIEMLPDMPDLAEELQIWQPKGYVEHFRESAIADRELAIEAYPHSPEQYRLPFEFTIRAVTRRVEALRDETMAALNRDDADTVRRLVGEGLSGIHDLMGVANAIIHGCASIEDLATHGGSAGETVETPLEPATDENGEPIMSQDEIDSLFD